MNIERGRAQAQLKCAREVIRHLEGWVGRVRRVGGGGGAEWGWVGWERGGEG